VDEAELIQRVLRREPAAERELYDGHVERVYRLCYRLAGGDPDLAADFAQETFVRAFQKLGTFQGRSRLSTWLHAVAVSVALNGMRKVKRTREREAPLDSVPAAVLATRDRQAEPDLKQRLREAVGGLPEKYRTVFVMYDVEGYTHEEIGAALAMPVGTSKARLSRARAKLRECLAEFAGEWAL